MTDMYWTLQRVHEFVAYSIQRFGIKSVELGANFHNDAWDSFPNHQMNVSHLN